MNEKIYRCLNGAQIDLDEFEEIPMTGAQRKRIEKLAKQSANRRRKVWGERDWRRQPHWQLYSVGNRYAPRWWPL